ncbi:MAG: hypothetical protein N2246_06480 [Candidatus Sumerlaeia bacterium]|nr:hypothetical protein [Candidatus Sumerlaeia bacterium]
MSTILKALEKARQERERQLKHQQEALTEGIKQTIRKESTTIASSATVSPPSTPSIPSRFSLRILVFATIFFGLSFVVLGVAIYFVLRMEKQVKTRPVEKIIVEKVEIREPAQMALPSTPSTPPSTKTETNKGMLSSREVTQNLTPGSGNEINARVKQQTQSSIPQITTDKTLTSPPTREVIQPPPATEAVISNSAIQSSPPRDTPSGAEPPAKSLPVSSPPVESPFSPREVTPETLGLTIEGIFWDEKKPMAIINGTIVGEGDRAGGVDIVKIYKKSIQVKKDSVLYNVLF